MSMAIEFGARHQPLHGHRHARRQAATLDTVVVSQRNDIDVAGLKGLTYIGKFSVLPHTGFDRLLIQAVAKVLI
ncbi:hypothetical protein D3C84_1066040 [compost metagenome]